MSETKHADTSAERRAGIAKHRDYLKSNGFQEHLWREADDLLAMLDERDAELTRLRERLRWRTVSADGLPAAGERVLVERKGRRHFCEVFQDAEDGRNWSGVPFRDGDRWLPVPEESE